MLAAFLTNEDDVLNAGLHLDSFVFSAVS